MEFWNNIINAALLGTDKKHLGREELAVELSDVFMEVSSNEEIDREEKFLQIKDWFIKPSAVFHTLTRITPCLVK